MAPKFSSPAARLKGLRLWASPESATLAVTIIPVGPAGELLPRASRARRCVSPAAVHSDSRSRGSAPCRPQQPHRFVRKITTIWLSPEPTLRVASSRAKRHHERHVGETTISLSPDMSPDRQNPPWLRVATCELSLLVSPCGRPACQRTSCHPCETATNPAVLYGPPQKHSAASFVHPSNRHGALCRCTVTTLVSALRPSMPFRGEIPEAGLQTKYG